MGQIGNKNTYIMSLEASHIYSHMDRNRDLKKTYVGMIPFSLELIKLKKEGLKIKINKETGKETTDDIINVKFKQKVQNNESIIKVKKKALTKLNQDILNRENELNIISKKKNRKKLTEKINKLKKYKIKVNNDIEELKTKEWKEIKNDKLRERFYNEGFIITDINKETGKIIETKYVSYKRSSAKSRTGQCLFIKEELNNKMILWSRMGIKFDNSKEHDYAGLLAYEALVSSSLEDTVMINPNNILIIDDVVSKFEQECNIVKEDEATKLLNSFKDKYMVKNSLFDGESLLESTYFKEGQSMMLLRNHMFKSAAFNCNIQAFLKDYALENGINFETWELMNKYNQKILAKDVHLICTPTSLKALKFANLVGEEKDMWDYWKMLVQREDNIFGVCKHEKESKRGYDFNGNILQQTSYQMINSIPFSESDIAELTTFEKQYIDKLKNDIDFFLEYIKEKANDMNSNIMLYDIVKRNKDFIGTKIFRDFKKGEINKHVTHVKKGKVRLVGDYCIVLGNPVEYLYHAIGKLNVNNPEAITLKDNEIYTKLFSEIELVAFRNPHTSPSNCLLAKNKYIPKIDRYFNLSKNIMCCNAIKFPIQDIASSMDYDSDSMVIFDNETLLRVIKEKVWGKYLVCINGVHRREKSYEVNKKSMFEIDKQLATSQKNIGSCVNTGQLIMSEYWDLVNEGETSVEKLDKLMKKVDVATVLSCICIDLAKKMYDINLDKEIKNLEEGLRSKKPNFFKNVSQSKNIGNKVEKYNTAMDYLDQEMSNLKYADPIRNIDFLTLLDRKNLHKADRKQEDKIIDYVEEMTDEIKYFNAIYKGEDDNTVEERNNSITDVAKYYGWYIHKLSVKEDTMYSILVHLIKNNMGNISANLLNILYITQKETFLKAFMEKK